MRVRAVVCVSAALIAVACGTAAASDSDAFLDALRDEGLPIDKDWELGGQTLTGSDYAVAMGTSTCEMLRDPDFPDTAAPGLVRNGFPEFTDDQVTFFVDASAQYLCPE